MTSAVERNGGAAGKTAQELAETASALQRVTTFSDEAIQEMQALLLSFQSIKGDNFDRATQSVLDLATRLGKDLPSAALLVGKALSDPVKGMNQLARAGAKFSADQKKVVEQLVNTGRQAEAVAIILDRLDSSFGGAASAARDNFAGALTGLKNAFGDLLEVKGGLPQATAAINDLTDALSDPKTKQGVDSLTSALVQLGAVAIKALAGAADGVSTIGDHLLTLKILATRGIDIPVDLSTEEIDAELQRLEARIELQRTTTRLLIPTALEKLETAELQRRVAELRKLKVAIPVEFQTPAAGVIAGPEAAPVEISEDARREIDKITESVKDATTKVADFEAHLRDLAKLAPDEITPAVAQKAIDDFKKSLEKPVKSAGLSKAQQEINSAKESIADFVAGLEQQRATLGQGEAAALRYSVTQGDIAKSLAQLGPIADETRQKLLDLIAVTEKETATHAIEEQIAALREEAATVGLTEQQLLEYQITQGELAKTLGKTAEEQARLTDEYRKAAQAAADARAEGAKIEEGKRVFEETRTDAEKYAAELERLRKLLETPVKTADFSVPAAAAGVPAGATPEQRAVFAPDVEAAAAAAGVITATGQAAAKTAIDFDTYGRAVAKSISETIDAGGATADYNAQLQELDRLLAEGIIPNQEAYNAAVGELKRRAEDAAKIESEAFVDEAKRASQRAGAEFLKSFNFKSAVKDFDDALRDMAANAVSARIMDKLFAGLDGWLSKIGGLFTGGGGAGGFGSLFAGIGSFFAGLFEEGGYIPPRQVGVVGESRSRRAAPELVVSGRRSSRERADFLAAAMLGVVRPGPRPVLVGASRDGRERPQLAYGGARGVTVIPLELDRDLYAGRFAEGGFIPAGRFGVVGDSVTRQAAPELAMSGRLGGASLVPAAQTPTETTVNHISVTVDAPVGTVSRRTAQQTGAEIARQLTIAKTRGT